MNSFHSILMSAVVGMVLLCLPGCASVGGPHLIEINDYRRQRNCACEVIEVEPKAPEKSKAESVAGFSARAQ